MDFSKYLDDSYEIITGKALYKINGGNLVAGGANGGSFEQTKYGNQAYEAPKNDNTGGSTPTAPKGGEEGSTDGQFQVPPSSGAGSQEHSEISITKGNWGSLSEQENRDINMQQYKGKEDENGKLIDFLMNGKTKDKDGLWHQNTFSHKGCKMQAAAKILSEIRGKLFSLLGVNGFDKNKDGLLTQEEITNGINANLPEGKKLTTDYFEYTLNKKVLDNISKRKGTTYVLGRAENVAGGQHWVVLEGYTMNKRGQIQFNYNGTSGNDTYSNRQYILGTPLEGQNNYFRISKIEMYTIE